MWGHTCPLLVHTSLRIGALKSHGWKKWCRIYPLWTQASTKRPSHFSWLFVLSHTFVNVLPLLHRGGESCHRRRGGHSSTAFFPQLFATCILLILLYLILQSFLPIHSIRSFFLFEVVHFSNFSIFHLFKMKWSTQKDLNEILRTFVKVARLSHHFLPIASLIPRPPPPPAC